MTHSIFSVNFGPGFGTVLVRDARVSFSDKLGTIGGTLGIFVGASFLSIFAFASTFFGYIYKKITLNDKSLLRDH